jgi:outer membrane protein assembly factor BamA
MPNFLLRILLVVCIAFGTTSAIAQDTIKKRKVKVLPVPAFGYSPETKSYIGAVCLLTMNLYDDTLTRSSNAKAEFNYSWNKQIITELEWNYFFKEEKWFTRGFVHYSKYPDNYFGIGSSTSPEGKTLFESDRVRLELEVLKKIKGKWFVGIDTRHLNYFDFSVPQDTIVYDELKTESRTGFGWIVQNDKRDNLLTPTKGSYLRLANNYNFGSSTYSQLILDGRKYFNWGKKIKQVVSTRFYSKHIIGAAPFYDLSLIGGDRFVRGYFFGRFRDDNLTTLQAEYRALLFWRIGVAAFGGTSLVYANFADFNSSTFKPNAGIGLRFLVDKEEGTNLRFDYAIGMNGESGFYVSFGESF